MRSYWLLILHFSFFCSLVSYISHLFRLILAGIGSFSLRSPSRFIKPDITTQITLLTGVNKNGEIELDSGSPLLEAEPEPKVHEVLTTITFFEAKNESNLVLSILPSTYALRPLLNVFLIKLGDMPARSIWRRRRRGRSRRDSKKKRPIAWTREL